jgi:mRNA interferase MazF
MSVKRGEIVLLDWPFSGGGGGKRRPALVVQNDTDNLRLTNAIVAIITSTTRRAASPTQMLIQVGTPDGKKTGLRLDSVVNCANIFTVEQSKVLFTIGSLTAPLMHQVDECLKVSLALS